MQSRLSRAQRDAQDRQDAPWLKQPLNDNSAPAHLRHMVKLLRNKRAVSPCSDAADHVHALYDRTIAHIMPPASQQRLACKQGCAHCCLQPVGLTLPEAFAIARQIQDRESTRTAILEAGNRIAAAPRNQRLFNMRCPMLVDNACSIYEQRPLNCHNFVSYDVNACFSKFVMLGNADVRGPEEQAIAINACRALLYAAFGLIGRPDFTVCYEMKAALAALLEMEADVERRWLAGEDVMAGIDPLPGVEPEFAWSIRGLMDGVAPTL